MTDALDHAAVGLPAAAAVHLAGLLVGGAVAVAYDGPSELLPVASALALVAAGACPRRRRRRPPAVTGGH